MRNYVCTRFDNENANRLAEKIQSLGSWLYRKDDGLGLQKFIDETLSKYKKPIKGDELDKIKSALRILLDGNKYSKNFLVNIFNQIKTKTLVYDDEGRWVFVNKLNTNYNDLAELITYYIFIKNNYVDEASVLTTDKLKKLLLTLKNRRIGGEKDTLENLIGRHIEDLDDLATFTNNTIVDSEIGERNEAYVSDYLEENGFKILYRGGDGDFIDMLLGIDIIARDVNNNIYTIQVKSSGPFWRYLGRYKTDWIGIGNGSKDLVKIYDRRTKKDITENIKIN